MASQTLPADGDYFGPGNWPTLVGEKGYKLFAVGNGRAVIVERLPKQIEEAQENGAGLPASSAGAALVSSTPTQSCQPLRVLLTHVSRGLHATRSPSAVGEIGQQTRPHWHGVCSVQPLEQLKAYLAKQCENSLMFFTHSFRETDASAGADCGWLNESAECIGRGLGLGEEDLDALRVASLVRQLKAGSHSESTLAETVVKPQAQTEPREGCQFPDCAEPASVSLLDDRYCLAHFIHSSYERLFASLQELAQRPTSEEAAERLRNLFSSCIEQATSLTRGPAILSTLAKARLMDIRYTASELRRRLRRSPRVADSRPVRLVCETPGHPWQEEARTLLISRYGARFECEHLVRPDDRLYLEWMESGRRTRVRMVWRRPGKLGCFAIGVEFLDSDNFWGINWAVGSDPASLPS